MLHDTAAAQVGMMSPAESVGFCEEVLGAAHGGGGVDQAAWHGCWLCVLS
jgi:hypothetical protein